MLPVGSGEQRSARFFFIWAECRCIAFVYQPVRINLISTANVFVPGETSPAEDQSIIWVYLGALGVSVVIDDLLSCDMLVLLHLF